MPRLCERPGCSQVAEMTYGFDAEQVMVWIDSFDRVLPGQAGVLCRRHADAMVVPLGWMLDDRRDLVPRLFRTAPQITEVAPRQRRMSTSDHNAGEQLELGADADCSNGEDVDIGVDAMSDAVDETVESVEQLEPAVPPWKPTFDQTDDLDGLLEAHSPLLARAFGGHDRRRPVR